MYEKIKELETTLPTPREAVLLQQFIVQLAETSDVEKPDTLGEWLLNVLVIPMTGNMNRVS